jgi:hypothetical protein
VTLRLATRCFANQPTVQTCGGSGWNRTVADWLKARCTAFVLRTRNWSPSRELHTAPRGYESRAPLSELEGRNGARPANRTPYLPGTNRAHRQQCLRGNWSRLPRVDHFRGGTVSLHVWCQSKDLRLPVILTKDATRYLVLTGKLASTDRVERSHAILRRDRAEVRRRGDEMASLDGVEPSRIAFVAQAPNSLGPARCWWCRPDSNWRWIHYEWSALGQLCYGTSKLVAEIGFEPMTS